MNKVLIIGAAVALAGLVAPQQAEACGGFFCGQQPVDQQAERIIFAVDGDAGTVRMITQISYAGAAANFAWVVPLAAVPEAGSFDTFPQLAMTALDANTGPQFSPEGGCFLDASAGPPSAGGDDGDVTVHVREEVGPYDVAVIESEDPEALVAWLRAEGFRVTSPMQPYIDAYTEDGMKFLALRLRPEADVSEIAPFAMTLPGQAPAIPLKMTALAAEPEMGILVTILGDQRYEPTGVWRSLEVDPAELVFDYSSWTSNWTALVARTVDAEGLGFVTEMAGATAPLLERALARPPADAEQEAAQAALVELLEAHPYVTRLYTRLSAEEMTSDPMFRRSAGADVERFVSIPDTGDGTCDGSWGAPGTADSTLSPCDFATCGAGGLCREADVDGTVVAACACVPGATARTTFDPAGRATVICQDQRMSFLNPGDRELPGAEALPDPCVGFDCGAGRCIAMNMTPTCECAEGAVAIGSFAAGGGRLTSCLTPLVEVPGDFYNRRLTDRPSALPAGRFTDVPPPAATGGGCSVGGHGSSAPTFALVALVGLALTHRRRG